MALAEVQQGTVAAAAAGTSISVVLGSTPTANNLLVALVHARGNNAGQITVPAGWTTDITASCGEDGVVGLYSKVVVADSATVTFTMTNSAQFSMTVIEVSGNATSSVTDKTAKTDSSGVTVLTTSSGTTATTTQADEIAVAGIACDGTVGWTNVWTNSFVQQSALNSSAGGSSSRSASSMAYRIVSATGAQESTEVWTTLRKAGGVIATYKAAAASGVQRAVGGGSGSMGISIPPTGAVSLGVG